MRMTKTSILGAVISACLSFEATAFQVHDLFKTSNSVWPTMAAHFKLTQGDTSHRLVRQEIYAVRHGQYDLYHLTQNAQPYIFYVYQQTQLRGMPAELALLPMVESDYSPFEHSQVGATGLWQLMPTTASGFGIKMNWSYDGRRDIISSTNAALNYLQYLHDTFHSWDLAIAAYNCGPGTVMNAIHTNQRLGLPTDFWDLPLPEETKLYVPKLLAFASVIQQRGHYGVQLMPIPNQPYFKSINLHKEYKITQLAQLAQMKTDNFRNLNPAFRSSKVTAVSSYNVLVPIHNAPKLVQDVTKQVTAQTGAHRFGSLITNGEMLSMVAYEYNTTLPAILTMNGLRKAAAHIEPAQQALLSKVLLDAGAQVTQQAQSTATNQYANGDMLSLVAYEYNTTLPAVLTINGLQSAAHQIEPAQQALLAKVMLSASAQVTQPAMDAANAQTAAITAPLTYKVKQGDNITRIAQRFGVTAQDLYIWNHFTESEYLQPGMQLTVSR